MIVNQDAMLENINRQNGLIMAEKMMLELVNRGMARDEAHEALRVASMRSIESGVNLEGVCKEMDEVTAIMGLEEIEGCFDPKSHLGSSREIVLRSVASARDYCGN